MSEATNQEQATPETTPAPRLQCRHIHTDGRRCASPTLRGPAGPENFCYYHHTTRVPIRETRTHRADLDSRQARLASFDLPLPEDRSAIQHAIGQILIRIAANQLDPRRAGLLLYGLQIASLNLPKIAAPTPAEANYPDPTLYVDEVGEDPTHGPLAPVFEINQNPHKEKGLEQILREQWERDRVQREEDEAKFAARYHPTILPNLQAGAPSSSRLSRGHGVTHLPRIPATSTEPGHPKRPCRCLFLCCHAGGICSSPLPLHFKVFTRSV